MEIFSFLNQTLAIQKHANKSLKFPSRILKSSFGYSYKDTFGYFILQICLLLLLFSNIGKTFCFPRSSRYGMRLMFQRSWVRIPAPYTLWTFFTSICCKNCNVCLKRRKNEKEDGNGQFF